MLTPAAQAFTNRFGATADQVATGTGFNRWAMLVQWAVETAIGAKVFGNNPGNIECGPAIFCQYATLNDFATACAQTWHSTAPPPLDPWRAGAVGQPMRQQLLSIGQSPWDAGRYGLKECGFAGCSLINMWLTEFGGIGDPVVVVRRRKIASVSTATSAHQFLRGKANAAGNRGLYHRRIVGGVFSPWTEITGGNPPGVGNLGSEIITPVVDENGKITVTIIGGDGNFYDASSVDDGATWSNFTGPFGSGDGIIGVNAIPVGGGLTPTESLNLQQIHDKVMKDLA